VAAAALQRQVDYLLVGYFDRPGTGGGRRRIDQCHLFSKSKLRRGDEHPAPQG
jgi:hypothetical protein